MAYLTKDQVKQVINGRPSGVTPQQVLQGLQSKGHQIEGFNDKPETPDAWQQNNLPAMETRKPSANFLENLANAPADLGRSMYNIAAGTSNFLQGVANKTTGAGMKEMGERVQSGKSPIPTPLGAVAEGIIPAGKQLLTSLWGIAKSPLDIGGDLLSGKSAQKSLTETGKNVLGAVTAPLHLLSSPAQAVIGTAWHEGIDQAIRKGMVKGYEIFGQDPYSEQSQQNIDSVITALNLIPVSKHAYKALEPVKMGYETGKAVKGKVMSGYKAAREATPDLKESIIAAPMGVSTETVKTALRREGLAERVQDNADVAVQQIADKAISAVENYTKGVSTEGKAYEPIKTARTPIQGAESFLTPLIKELGYNIDKQGKLQRTQYAKTTEGARELQSLVDDYRGKSLDSESMLALRDRLYSIADYTTPKGMKVEPLEAWGRKASGQLNELFRGQVEGLEALDLQMSPKLESGRKLNAVLRKLQDEHGNLRPQAMSVLNDIANGKKTEFTKVMEEAMGEEFSDFQRQVRIANALKDIQRIETNKRSLGVTGGIVGGSLLTAPFTGGASLAVGIIGLMITNPKFLLPLLERGAKYLDNAKAPEIANKIEMGDKLSKAEVKVVSDALNNLKAEDVANVAVVDALSNQNAKLHSLIAINMPDNLRNSLVSVTNMRRVLESNNLSKTFIQKYDNVKLTSEFKGELTKLKATLGKNPSVSVGQLMSAVKDFMEVDGKVLESAYLGEIRKDIVSYLLGEANKQTNGGLGNYFESLGTASTANINIK